MSTFLELAQDLRREPGVSGSGPVTVVNQTGLLEKLCRWIADADNQIQTKWEDWNFMWNEWEIELVATKRTYLPPDIFGLWDRSSFALDYRTANYTPIKYADYLNYRDKIASGEQTQDQPSVVTMLPNHTLAVFPIPAVTGSKLKADFWARPVRMTNDGDISRIPPRFHRIIVVRAKMMYAEHMSNQGLFNSAYAEYVELLDLLESAELPERRTRTSRQDVQMVVRAV